MTTVATPVVTLRAQTEQFRQGMQSASDSTRRVSRSSGDLAVSLRAVAAVAATAAAAISALAVRAVATGEEIRRMSLLANANTTEFQRMAIAAGSVGISTEKVGDILKDVNDRVGDFLQTGGGPLADFFENIGPRVGVTIDQFRTLSGPQALQLLTTSLERANISQQDMTFYMEAIASDATALIPLFRDNGAALNALADDAQRSGAILSESQIAALASVSAEWRRFGETSSGVFNGIVADNAAFIAEATRYASAALSTLRNNVAVSIEIVSNLLERPGLVIRVIGRNMQIFATQTAATMLRVVAYVAEAFDGLRTHAINALNAIITAINMVPQLFGADGFDLLSADAGSGAAAAVRDYAASWDEVAQSARDARDAQLQAAGITGRFQTISDNLPDAVTVPSAPDATPTGTGFSPGVAGGQTRSELAEALERLRQGFRTAREIAQEERDTDLRLLREGLENELLTEEQFANRRAQVLDRFRQQERQLDAAAFAAKTVGLRNGLETALNLTQAFGVRNFGIQKKLAISEATVDGLKAAVTAYASAPNPFTGAALAALSLSRTGALISQIRSTGPSGGGAGGAGGAGAGSAPGAITPVRQAPLQVNLSGLSGGQLLDGADVGALLERLTEEAGDRGLTLTVQR